MNRTIAVSEFKKLIMGVLESENYITICKGRTPNSPTLSFSIPVSSCSTTKNGFLFNVGTGYINLEFSDSSSEDTLIHFRLREADDNPNQLMLDLGEIGLLFNRNVISHLLKINERKETSNIRKRRKRKPNSVKEVAQSLIEGRSL
jgi:hypothetical protein